MAVAPESHPYELVALPHEPRPDSASGDLVRFAAVGAVGYVVNLLVFALLERSLRAGHTASATGAFAVAVLNNYAWNRQWTFRTRAGPVGRQAVRFAAVSVAGLVADLATLHLLVRLGTPSIAAQAVGVVVAMPVTFLGSRLWSFRLDAEAPLDDVPVTPLPRPWRPRVVAVLPVGGGGAPPAELDAVSRQLGERAALVVVTADGGVPPAPLPGRGRTTVVAVRGGRSPAQDRLAGLRQALALRPELVLEISPAVAIAPEELPAVLGPAESGAGVVVGTPRARGGARGAVSRLAERAAARLLCLPLRAPDAAVACYRASALDDVDLGRAASPRGAFASELAYRAGTRVHEVPVATPPTLDAPERWEALLEAAVRLAELRLGALAARVRRYGWVIRWWALSRALVLVPALVVQLLSWPRASWYPSVVHRPFALLGAWDGRWYRMVAERGYFVIPHHQSDTAFFPLFPIVLRGLHALGLSFTTGGLVLGNVGFLLGLVALYELSRSWVGEADARRTVVYAAIFPAGFVFSMVYPEGLVLAIVACAGVLASRGRWTGAAILAALAVLARPEGIFLALPFAALARRQWAGLDERSRARALWAILAGPAALAALCAYYLRAAGDPLAFSHAQLAWGRWTSLDGVGRALHELVHASALGREWLYRDAIFCALYLVALVLAVRARVPLSWVVAGALIVLLPLWSGSFTSDARFGLLAIPVYTGLAYLARRRWLDVTLRAASGVVLAASSATILLHWP